MSLYARKLKFTQLVRRREKGEITWEQFFKATEALIGLPELGINVRIENLMHNLADEIGVNTYYSNSERNSDIKIRYTSEMIRLFNERS